MNNLIVTPPQTFDMALSKKQQIKISPQVLWILK